MRIWIVPAILLVAGCAGSDGTVTITFDTEPSGVVPHERGSDEYWMVWVHGRESEPCEGPSCVRTMCSIAFDHEVDPAARTFRHVNGSDPGSPWVVVAFDHFGEGGCPILYKHAFDTDRFEEKVDSTGFTLDVHANGTLVVNGGWLPLGKRERLTYDDGGVTGEILIENLGAWKHAGITASRS